MLTSLRKPIFRPVYQLFYLLIFCLSLNPFEVLGQDAKEFLLEQTPSYYKGRIRPLDAAARLWLKEYYHRQTIKRSHINDFHLASSSPLPFLWRLQFSGHENWEDSPLFWIHSAQLKALLDLPLKNNYFSYNQLIHAVYEKEKTNLALVDELIAYYFLKAYFDPSNRAGNNSFELQQLASGLFVSLKNGKIFVQASPNTPLLQFVKKEKIVTASENSISLEYVRQHQTLNDEIISLLQSLNHFSQLNGPYATDEKDYETAYKQLQKRDLLPNQIYQALEQTFPFYERLAKAGTLFYLLPAKNGEWYSLNTLTLKSYDASKNGLQPIENFTAYSNEQFEKIREAYFQLIYDHEDAFNQNALAQLLIHNYRSLANQTMQKAWQKSLTYPSTDKLKMEFWYYALPLNEITMVLYLLAIVLLILGWNQKKQRVTQIGTFFIVMAFGFNTSILAIRCFILGRPPVSNMFETVIYVPWIAVLTSLLLSLRIKNSAILIGSATVAVILLVLLKITGLADHLENVQAVLDSQFWLTVHVMMVVASYGVFALGGILGQFYLFQYVIHGYETFSMQEIGKAILQALYLGVALLIPGTILGGVWAAQSWGRFWDWDPKESWAFISSCVYLIFIHAYTFKYIRYFGLAIGAVLGLLVISFTWYGVNYILGIGLHSYGFGSGGEIYYYLFILAELIFLCSVAVFRRVDRVLIDKR